MATATIRTGPRPARLVVAIGLAAALLTPTTALAQARDEPAEPQPEVPYPSPEWAAREAANFARTTEAPTEHLQPAFQERLQAQTITNFASFLARQAADPAWRTTGNLCETWGEQCAGDPFRWPGVDPFYDDAVVEEVVFVDRGGARLQGRVWAPATGDALPGVVITNGSVQAPEPLYWWAAQALVRAGYVVMTFDPRGQGRSDNTTPTGEQGSNANPAVFVTNTIDAIDFFRSVPERPYAPNVDDARPTTAFNPLWERIDRGRLGSVGHSLGAAGVSITQGIEPWPGDEGDPDGGNPVDVVVGWDNLGVSTGGEGDGTLAGYPLVPRVPAMGQSSDYFLTPTPYLEPPDPDDKRLGYLAWQAADLPTYQVVIEGGTHYEFSLLATFPATSWEAGGAGGWGRPLVEHYTLAWLDRWLKETGEPGFADADARLLADDAAGPQDGPSWRQRMSFYYRSSRDFPTRTGVAEVCEDIRVGCDVDVAAPVVITPEPAPTPTTQPAVVAPQVTSSPLPSTGGGLALLGLALAGLGARTRRR